MTIENDAIEFGHHVRQGGWRLGLLVARNVEPDTGHGGDRRSDQRRNHDVDPASKVSARQFAKLSGTSTDRVLRHLDAWERAAVEGVVVPAGDLTPGSTPDLDVDRLPEWSEFYTSTSTVSTSGTIRSAQALIRKDPAQVAKLVDDSAVREAVEDHVASSPAATARVSQQADRLRPRPGRHEPRRSATTAAASLARLESVVAQLRQAVDEVVAEVMDGQADPTLLAEPLAALETDVKRLRIAAANDQRMDEALADLLREDG